MAIQMRRGNAAQYDESKMVAGEFAVSVDSEELHIAFATGESKKVLTEDDYVPQIFRNVWTGRCSTAAATDTKTVTLDDDEGFNVHTAGYTIAVYFVAGNTADFPKLNVNGTGALSVKRGTSSSGASVSGIDARWGAGIQFFTYQGGYWIHSSADPVAVSNLANNKADLNSPALTGTPTAPTAVSGTDTTQIATTAFVQEAVDKQGQANIAPSFSASTAYSAGDYVIYNGKLYQFTSAHAAGAWTGTDAEECTVTERLGGGSGDGLTEDIKQALLQIAEKVAYIDEDGQDYYDALYDALYPVAPPAELVSISAVYTQSGTVYDIDTLDSLKSDLVVTALYDDQSTRTVTTYTLSGTLAEGTSIITVSYDGKTTTFNVTVTSTILYEVLNKAYNKTDLCDDTNVQLMATDTDFTILMDGVQENAIPTGDTVRIMFCADADSNWKGIFLGAGASASAYALQWMNSNAGDFGFNRNVGGTSFKIAYRHTAGSGKVDAFIKINDGTVITRTITSPYGANSSTLKIGGASTSTTNSNWVGTMNLCRLHNVALPDDYINAFMAT